MIQLFLSHRYFSPTKNLDVLSNDHHIFWIGRQNVTYIIIYSLKKYPLTWELFSRNVSKLKILGNVGPFGSFIDKYANQGKCYNEMLDDFETEYKNHPKWEQNKEKFMEYRNAPIKAFNMSSIYKEIILKSVGVSKYRYIQFFRVHILGCM